MQMSCVGRDVQSRRGAVADIVEQIEISRSPAEVWRELSDFGGLAIWAPNVDHSSLTTTTSQGVDMVRRVQVGRNALLERVIEWEPEARMSYRIEGLPPVLRLVTNTWDLAAIYLAASSGGTTVTLTSSVDAGPRPPQQVIARIASRRLAQDSRKMLTGLNDHLTSTTTSKECGNGSA